MLKVSYRGFKIILLVALLHSNDSILYLLDILAMPEEDMSRMQKDISRMRKGNECQSCIAKRALTVGTRPHYQASQPGIAPLTLFTIVVQPLANQPFPNFDNVQAVLVSAVKVSGYTRPTSTL